MKTQPAIGTRVRLTPANSFATLAKVAGGEGHSRWTVQPCDCGLCTRHGNRFVAVDEPSTDDPSRQRHINIGNLEKCR